MLSENITRHVARRVGLSSICVNRLLGSVRVKYGADGAGGDDDREEPVPAGKLYQLGFNVDSHELLRIRDHSRLITMLAQILAEYKRVCPLIVIWVGRGDFNPNKIPDNVTGGHILHANRTVGRLKAKLLRQINSSSQP